MKHALTLIVLLPLVGFLLNGFLATRFGGNRGGKGFVTTALEPTLAPADMVMGPSTFAPAPITIPSSSVG